MCKNNQCHRSTSVTSIGSEAFYGCTVLISATVPSNATFAGSTFDSCTNLASITVVSPYSTFSVASGSFNFCSSATCVAIPQGTASIGQNDYYGCFKLSYVPIPSSVTNIGDGAFQ